VENQRGRLPHSLEYAVCQGRARPRGNPDIRKSVLSQIIDHLWQNQRIAKLIQSPLRLSLRILLGLDKATNLGTYKVGDNR